MERNLALELVRTTEAAAIACARWMGRGDEQGADRAAIAAMHASLSEIDMDAVVMIGEGDRESASKLHIGERLGTGLGPRLELALDALEGSTICATGGPNALSAIAAAEEGGFLRVPDTYMDKLVVGPHARGAIDIDRSPRENLHRVAEAMRVPVEELAIVILDRPRHEKLIEEVRQTRARIKLIKDGDVSAAIATCARDREVDVLMGVGGAPEGVMAAAALRCMGGEIQARLRPRNEQEAERARSLGIDDLEAKLTLEDLASGDVMFAATGVTSGDCLEGVRFRSEGAVTQSVVMRSRTGTIRYVRAEHVLHTPDE